MSKKTCISLKYFVYSTLSIMKIILKMDKDEKMFKAFKNGYEIALIDILTYMKLSKDKDISEEIRKIIKEIKGGE